MVRLLKNEYRWLIAGGLIPYARTSASVLFGIGFAFTLFEIFVAFLQAYVFAILTAVYIQLAVAEEH